MPYLFGAQLRHPGIEPALGKRVADSIAREAEQIGAAIGARRRVARQRNRIDVAGQGHERVHFGAI